MTERILVIRGGAIGDFILTLPAVKLLRDNFPNAHIEILGYKQLSRWLKTVSTLMRRARSNMRRFRASSRAIPNWRRNSSTYFGSFDLVLSYLFDPDEIFAANVRRCGVRRVHCGVTEI